MSEEQIASVLANITLRINQTFPIFLIVFGTFGHIFNIIIFLRRSQRTNPISIYFLGNTFANLIVLYNGFLIRFIQDVSPVDFSNTNLVVCKVRFYLLYYSLSLSNWFILLATIDRYLLTSKETNMRQSSTVKNSYRWSAVAIILCGLLYIHILVLSKLYPSSTSSGTVCSARPIAYRIFTDIQLLFQFSLLPPMAMSIFSVLIMRNIRHSHRVISNSIIGEHQQRIRKRDLQLNKMLVLQVFMTVICSLPFVISQLIATITLTWSKTILQIAIESFFISISRDLALLNCSISFYLYTLAGSQFRLEFYQLCNQFWALVYRQPLIQTERLNDKPRSNRVDVAEKNI